MYRTHWCILGLSSISCFVSHWLSFHPLATGLTVFSSGSRIFQLFSPCYTGSYFRLLPREWQSYPSHLSALSILLGGFPQLLVPHFLDLLTSSCATSTNKKHLLRTCTFSFPLVFDHRAKFGEEPSQISTEFNLRVFYPAQSVSGSSAAPFCTDLGALKLYLPMIPSFLGRWLAKQTMSNSFSCPLLVASASHFPVVLYSHGQGGSAEKLTRAFEKLASEGYVVVFMDHYNDWLKGIPGPIDRRFYDVKLTMYYLRVLNEEPNLPSRILQQGNGKFKTTSLTAFQNPFHNTLDLSSIGIFGHSMGAMTSALLCSEYGQRALRRASITPVDPTVDMPLIPIRCGVGLDIWFEPYGEDQVMKFNRNVPFLAVLSEHWAGPSAAKYRLFGEGSDEEYYEFWMKGGFHQNGTDGPYLMSPTFWGNTSIAPLVMCEREGVKWPRLDLSQDGIVHNQFFVENLFSFFEFHFRNQPYDAMSIQEKYEEYLL